MKLELTYKIWNNILQVCWIYCVKMLLWIVRGNVQNGVFTFSNRERCDVEKKISEKETKDEPPNMREEMQGTLKIILDRIKTEIRNQFTRLSDLDEQLGFLLGTESLIDCCIWWQFWRRRARSRNCRLFIIPKTPIELFKFAKSYGNDAFPNLKVALRILLSVAVPEESRKRSFSKMKLIKNCFQSTIGQGRLSNLALLSIEGEEFEVIDVDRQVFEFKA